MQYFVTIAVDARVTVMVDADDPQEAKELGLDMFAYSDFEDLIKEDFEIVDYKAVNATDENDEMVDF